MRLSKNLKRSWLSLLILVFLVIAIFALPGLLRLFITNIHKAQPAAAGQNSKICLYACAPPSPATLTEIPNQQFSIPIIIDTDNATIRGVDVIVNFDTNFLTLADMTTSAAISTTLKTFLPLIANDPTGAFDKTTVISNANSTGNIKFGAATADWTNGVNPTPTISLTNSYVGSTTLAILTFTPKQIGTTNISLNFTSGSTVDTNLVSDTQFSDILASVNNLSLTVANPTPTPTVTPGLCLFHSSGDLNCDNIINIFDYNIILQDFGCPARTSPVCVSNWNTADVNGDSNINIFDYNILLQHFGQSVTPTP